MIKTVKLYGILAKKFGKVFRFDVNSPREAVRALSAQLKGFEQFMMTAHERGLTFAVFNDKHNISEQEIDQPTSAEVIKIVPKVIGAGGDNGVLQTILGAVLIVVGVVLVVLSQGVGSPAGQALITSGIGLMVGGIAQMLIPKAKTEEQNQDGNKANKGFGGAVTTIAQGNPVPVLRGKREIGGFIISAGQEVVDIL